MVPKYLLKAIENGDVSKFYKSAIWGHKRQEVLKRDNYECQRCKKEKKVNTGDDGHGKGLVIHHKKHLKEFPSLALKKENLITICESHHNQLHPEKFEKFRSNWKERDEPITEERW